ncbi:MAG: hypothetical protein E7639_04440 [Ruminococcaceae bacterium]|nr:hypothetical protein [Oscillospiraceae bacterium]
MAYFTNKRTSTQRAIGYAFIPFCLAYALWLIWPIISLISFWVKNSAPDFGFGELIAGFDWSIFWKMYLLAYVIGFVLLLGIKILAGGRIKLHRFRNLEGVLWMVFLYPIFVISEMYTFVTCDTDFGGSLGSLLKAIIKGGVLYLLCAIPTFDLMVGKNPVTLKNWFEDVPLMLTFAGIILMIWVLDLLWRWDNKGRIGVIVATVLYYVAALGAITLTVCGCIFEFDNLYLDDYFSLVIQVIPLCLPLALLWFYTPHGRRGRGNRSGLSVLEHILSLLPGLGLSFLGAYLLTVTKILFFVMLAIPFGHTVFSLVRIKGVPFANDLEFAERHRKLKAAADARFGSIYGNSSSGGSNAPVNQNLPEDKGCEKLRSRLKDMYGTSHTNENYGLRYSYKATLSTCRQGNVVWSASITVLSRKSDPSDPNDWQRKDFQDKWLKEEKERIRSFLISQTSSVIQDLAKHYKTYGGSWSVSVRI